MTTMRAMIYAAMLGATLSACGDPLLMAEDAEPMVESDDGGPITDAMPESPTSLLVDPSCTDGMYTEALPDPTVDLSDLEAAYDENDPGAFIEAAVTRRYPTGGYLIANGSGSDPASCALFFLRDSGSPEDIYPQLSTAVHECGHFASVDQDAPLASLYLIDDSGLSFSCSGGGTTDRGGQTFAKSHLRADEFQPLSDELGTFGNFYDDIYLDGDPEDDVFDNGDQGFDLLLEETVQYVNSLATAYAFSDEVNTGGTVSERDGILTFLWYITRYLRMARTEYPMAYDHIVNGDGGCFRDTVLTVWGRAWLYLEATRGMSHLGLRDEVLEEYVMDPDLLSEIQRLRDAAGCAAP